MGSSEVRLELEGWVEKFAPASVSEAARVADTPSDFCCRVATSLPKDISDFRRLGLLKDSRGPSRFVTTMCAWRLPTTNLFQPAAPFHTQVSNRKQGSKTQ